jgi:nitrate/nitrite-specific signal transduction histidine kinase
MLIYFVRKKEGVPFPRVFWLFGAFIILCGSTHLLDALIFYIPVYRLNALVLFVTGVVSWLTIIELSRLIPKALLLKTPAQLELVVNERTMELNQANKSLQQRSEQIKTAYEDLESKVKFRTLELEKTISRLQAELKALKTKE